MRANETEMRERLEKTKQHLIENGSTRGLVLNGIANDNQLCVFLKNYADEFSNIKFVKRGER